VRSERDAVTGKFRNRWTYLGRADAAERPAPPRVRRNARAALLDALERLFASVDPDAVTAAAIATEAGVAHGTFYRYFRNKQDAIVALVERVADAANERDALEAIPASRDAARVALRTWAERLLRKPERHGALFRALYTLSSQDAALLAHRRERREAFIRRLRAFLEMTVACGFATIDDPDGTALAIRSMIDGLFREALQIEPLDDARIAACVGVIERAVFGRL
jgi:AcrR family transcriptional regulator